MSPQLVSEKALWPGRILSQKQIEISNEFYLYFRYTVNPYYVQIDEKIPAIHLSVTDSSHLSNTLRITQQYKY